ncbi:MAG: hypothetical protein JNK56_09530 [Myxococcales bacterium]|nr:hypothetical protein [Myxococcales bacterium]
MSTFDTSLVFWLAIQMKLFSTIPMPMPSPGSHGGFSPVDDDPAIPVLVLPGSPVEPVEVSGSTPEVVPPVVVEGSFVVAVAVGSTVVLDVGEPVIVGSFVVVVIPTESDAEPVGVVVGVSPVPVIVDGASVALATVAPVDPWVPLALASVVPEESPQAADARTNTVQHPIHTRLCMRTILA